MAVDGDRLLQERVIENFVPEFFVHRGSTPAVGMAVLEARA
jgi:hypothetical protein